MTQPSQEEIARAAKWRQEQGIHYYFIADEDLAAYAQSERERQRGIGLRGDLPILPRRVR